MSSELLREIATDAAAGFVARSMRNRGTDNRELRSSTGSVNMRLLTDARAAREERNRDQPYQE